MVAVSMTDVGRGAAAVAVSMMEAGRGGRPGGCREERSRVVRFIFVYLEALDAPGCFICKAGRLLDGSLKGHEVGTGLLEGPPGSDFTESLLLSIKSGLGLVRRQPCRDLVRCGRLKQRSGVGAEFSPKLGDARKESGGLGRGGGDAPQFAARHVTECRCRSASNHGRGRSRGSLGSCSTGVIGVNYSGDSI